ncbi:protein of unknown function DUF1021 [Gottschalkia acidurici 9a]|uniref:Veg protein n=1 Tax=Gottschalkia acidurici (strain ATCC 7906 / DSM 604 / BCRC 14475 / CIP 104303 / KCTC 5404 / NCIMB 10678 / 9a) TaxID=1128398 RepID=K0AVC2_GOTA9|nr:Veg family protein [Gottschalkia acidurici]AFS77224.1 protein of unknown function DUF1021 [Gottschalkia acidurici 9a]
MQKNPLAEIRSNVENYIGQKVRLKANKGRKRTTVREGVIEGAYPSLFVVKIDGGYNSTRRVSYCYSDILTSTVELTVFDKESENEILIS